MPWRTPYTRTLLVIASLGVASGPPAADLLPVAPVRSALAAPQWRWPVGGPVNHPARAFEAPSSDWGPGHRGVDLLGTDGETVLAVASGVVRHAGRVAGRGTVTVEHADGMRSTYEPVDPLVPEGTRVEVGTPIATLHSSPHLPGVLVLHLGAIAATGYVDPWPLLRGGRRVVLLPLVTAAQRLRPPTATDWRSNRPNAGSVAA